MYVCIDVCMYIMHAGVYICMCVLSMYVCICMYVCMYVY